MGREINEDFIRELDEKIEGGVGDTIQLRRTRNSLLNISIRLSPEILGQIFCLAALGDRDKFDGLQRVSYSFTLVCHHWFEVAHRTPELWSYWGNTLAHWSQRYKRSGTAPVDLVLDRHTVVSLDGPIRGALRERAETDTIRSLHL